MCGCESWATARASRRKRSSWSESDAMSRCMGLTATPRWGAATKAGKRADIPPAPTWASSRYRPFSRVPTKALILASLLWLSSPVGWRGPSSGAARARGHQATGGELLAQPQQRQVLGLGLEHDVEVQAGRGLAQEVLERDRVDHVGMRAQLGE